MANEELVIYINCDNTVLISNLKVARTAGAVTTGTITMTLKDLNGVAVTGASALSLTYSSPYWYGTIPYSITLTEKKKYQIVISATDGTFTVEPHIKVRAEYYYGE